MAHQCLNSCTNPDNYETNKHYRDQPTPSHPFLLCCLCDIAIITDNLLCLIKSNITYSLLLSGDVHPNPGPLEDLLQLLAEQNNTPVFNIPQINLYPHMTIVTATIQECLLGYRCALCLKALHNYEGTFLPKG